MVFGADPWVIHAHTHRGIIRVSYTCRAALPAALCVQFLDILPIHPSLHGALRAAMSPAPAMPPPHPGLCPKEKAASSESNVKEEDFCVTFN